jgi:MATE family multidrug resistance protein
MLFTDRLFLSKLGMEQMSAGMGGGLNAFFLIAFFLGLLGYATAMTAQYFGRGESNMCAVVTTQTLIVSVAAYPVILAFIPLIHMLFVKSGISSVQLGYQMTYFNILVVGALPGLLRVAFSNFFSGIGKTKVVLVASFGAMIMNVIASYVLVFGKLGFPAMGVKGAAIGSITGTCFALAILLAAYFSRTNRKLFGINESFKVDVPVIKNLFRLGTPSGIEFFMIIFAFTLMIAVFHSHSPATAAAATIMFNWDHVSFVPLIGLEVGVTSLVGRYVGAGRHDIVNKTIWSGLRLGWMISVFIFPAFVFFPGALADVFKPAEAGELYAQVRELSVFMIRFASIYVFLNAVMLVYMGALKGAGDTFWSMVINVSFNWFILGCLWVTLNVLKMSAAAGWVVLVMVFLFLPLILFLRFKSGRWKQRQVLV